MCPSIFSPSQNKSRKLYMLFELEPSREVTGGAWYTDSQFDSEFIAAVQQLCLAHIIKQVGLPPREAGRGRRCYPTPLNLSSVTHSFTHALKHSLN